jgi:pimeloyl-ACP methyl ester carboxylesterase
MTAFVLVHGANWSGWTWRKVEPLLRAAGHDVHAPSLTGLGERAHLISPQVGLGTHIDDIVTLLEFEDLSGVVLVGSSYGGMVVSGVVDRVPERLAHAAYVDAHVPLDGESTLDLAGPASRAAREEVVRTKGAGWFVPPSGPEAFASFVARGSARRRRSAPWPPSRARSRSRPGWSPCGCATRPRPRCRARSSAARSARSPAGRWPPAGRAS